MNGRAEAKRRRWADLVVIIAAVYAILYAVFAPPGLGPDAAARDAADHGLWWWAHAAGGSLAIASVFLAGRSRALGRVAAALGAVILLAGLAAFDRIDWLAVRALVLPAVAILLATPFMGPMPSPEEEGNVRHGVGTHRP